MMMPCYTAPPTGEEMNAAGELTHGQLEAVLCGILTTHGDKLLDGVDYAEVGVPEALVRRWWKQHQAEDAKRKQRERAAEQRARAKKQAIAKLTAEERSALGL